MAKEELEALQVHVPVPQARWLRSRAELRGGSVSGEIRRAIHTMIQVEALAGAQPENILYVTAPAPEAA